jgi:NADPH:quinone reductase-like Zn-dependent oxidoreductase
MAATFPEQALLERETITALAITAHGGPEVLGLHQRPLPAPREGFVRVAIKAVSVNHLDLWVRRGLPHLKHRYPHVLGSDGAGVVLDALGDDSVGPGHPCLINPGLSCGRCEPCLTGQDNLCAAYGIQGENRPGIAAQVVSVPRANLLPFPRGLTWAEAATLPLTFLTAWQMLVLKAQLKPGQWVLIQAAGSGVGSAAIQIAKLFGAQVIATASTPQKLAQARALGADYVINYKEQPFLDEVRRLTDRRGVDVVFESVGQSVWADSLKALRWGGALVTCGATSGFDAQTDLRQVFFRQLQILGSTMGPKGALFEILRHVEAGRLKPTLDRAFPFSQAAAAHDHVEGRAHFGKVVLYPDGEDVTISPLPA